MVVILYDYVGSVMRPGEVDVQGEAAPTLRRSEAARPPRAWVGSIVPMCDVG